jgi:PII-like signaling protein
MQGYQVTFFTVRNRKHGAKPLGQWLLEEAQRLGVRGASLVSASEGFGQHEQVHSERFFELGDQPIEVTMSVTAEELERFMARLAAEQVKVFYTKVAAEFGTTGEV